MTTYRIALALALALISGSASAQSYNPGTREVPNGPQAQAPAGPQVPMQAQPGGPQGPQAAPAPQAPPRDYQAEAQQRFATWQQTKEKCFTDAGLTPGVHFRVSPQNPQTYQIKDSVWLNPNGFDLNKLRSCQN